MELTKIKIWPGWTATRLIGEGSFGKVYEIVRNNFGIEEHSALKIITIPSSQAELQSLKNDGMDDASATEYYRGLVDEFVQEIALMSKLKGNSNIVNYEDYAVIEHNVSVGWDILIRMELLTDLPAYIRDNSLSTNDVIKLGIDICNALEVCQTQKIIHRDIKPDNIFISTSGEFKLGDFGVARTIEKTVSGLSKKGTYTYMAPEVYKGESYGSTVDIYSLGIVMYKLLNFNREPFLPPHPQPIKYSDKNNALVRRISGDLIPAPANAEETLSKIILRACAHKSSERYQSASEMKKDLTALLNKTKSEQSAILQTDQVISSKTNSDTTPPVISTQKEENIAETEIIEETLPVTTQHNVESPVVTTPPAQKAQQSNRAPQVYVFGGQQEVPSQRQQQFKASQTVPNNQQQYRAPQTPPNYQQQYRVAQTPPNMSSMQNYSGIQQTQIGPSVTKKKRATPAIIMGIIGIVMAWLFALVGWILGGISLGFAITAVKNSEKRSKAALIISIVALVCSLISSVIGVILVNS